MKKIEKVQRHMLANMQPGVWYPSHEVKAFGEGMAHPTSLSGYLKRMIGTELDSKGKGRGLKYRLRSMPDVFTPEDIPALPEPEVPLIMAVYEDRVEMPLGSAAQLLERMAG